ncbi:MAG: hypothetical protein WBR18_09160 [Anaerolineales bacterium]
MPRFFIESPHTAENCTMVLKEIHSKGYLHHFDWGCAFGEHCGWAVMEAENEEQARMVVPSIVRSQAKVTQVSKFSVDDAERLHAIDK